MRARLPDSPWTTVVLSALLVGLFVALRLVSVGEPPAFVAAGDQYVDAAAAPHELVVSRGSGYDGQFIYRMELDPLPTTQTGHGITFDTPSYRAQRVVTPALAWGAVRVTPFGAAVSLLIVNVLALLVAAYFAGRLVTRFGA